MTLILENIYQKITERGWTLYDASDSKPLPLFAKEGPVTKLHVEKQYVVTPKIADDKNPLALRSELKKIAETGNVPLIYLPINAIPFCAFSIEPKKAIIHGMSDIECSLDDLLLLIDDLNSCEK